MLKDYVAKNVLRLREARGLTLEALASKTGYVIQGNMIGKIERGGTNPSFITIEAIAKGLRCAIWELFVTPENAPETNESLLVAMAGLQMNAQAAKRENSELKDTIANLNLTINALEGRVKKLTNVINKSLEIKIAKAHVAKIKSRKPDSK